MNKTKLFLRIMLWVGSVIALIFVLCPLILTHLYNINILTFEQIVIGILLAIFYLLVDMMLGVKLKLK